MKRQHSIIRTYQHQGGGSVSVSGIQFQAKKTRADARTTRRCQAIGLKDTVVSVQQVESDRIERHGRWRSGVTIYVTLRYRLVTLSLAVAYTTWIQVLAYLPSPLPPPTTPPPRPLYYLSSLLFLCICCFLFVFLFICCRL